MAAVPYTRGWCPAGARRRTPTHSRGGDRREALRQGSSGCSAAAFLAQAAAVSTVGVLLVSPCRSSAIPCSVAATVSGVLGVLSVTGRLVTTGVARRFGMTAVTAVVFAVQSLGVLALPHLGRTAGGAAACVVAFGLGFGVAIIAKPAIVADRYGTARYATIAATMATPITLPGRSRRWPPPRSASASRSPSPASSVLPAPLSCGPSYRVVTRLAVKRQGSERDEHGQDPGDSGDHAEVIRPYGVGAGGGGAALDAGTGTGARPR